MNARWRNGARRLPRFAWYALAALLVTMAVAAGVASRLLPLVERHPDRVAAWLSERAGRPVAFDHMTTEWTRRGPLLRVDGLRIGAGDAVVPIGEAEILVAQYSGLLPGRSFTELRLRGLSLALERDASGRWSVRGLPGDGVTSDPFAALEGLGELQVIGGRLAIDAPEIGLEATIPRIDARLRVDGRRVRGALRAAMAGEGRPIDAAFVLDRTRGDGSAHIDAAGADLAQWAPLLTFAGIVVADGDGRAEAWATLRDHRVDGVVVHAELATLRLQGAPMVEDALATRLDLGPVSVRARWRAEGADWRADASRLRIGAGGSAQTLDGLMVAGGSRFVLSATRIDAGPLLSVASLSDRWSPGTRRWLVEAKPRAVLHDVQVSGTGAALRARVDVERLRFDAIRGQPGLSDVSGHLAADGEGAAFTFDGDTPLRFDWPNAFGPVHVVRIGGTAAAWRDGDGWQVGTGGLQVRGSGYGADVRGGLRFPDGGGAPSIQLAAAVLPAQVPTAKRFWIRDKMPEAAVTWLDTALQGGDVRNGRAVVSGDLSHWPFDAKPGREGVFVAEADLSRTRVKFQPDWPAATQLDGRVRFIGNGFVFRGRTRLDTVDVGAIEAGIADFGAAGLHIEANAKSQADRLLALMRQSPFNRDHAETLANLEASGPAAAAVKIDIPLDHDDATATRIDGRVSLTGAKLAEKRWALAFDDVRGDTRFDQDGFTADQLDAVRTGQPGRLALRAGPRHVRDPSQAFEATLDTVLDAHDLLDRVPALVDWKPRVDGRSPWTVAVAVPVDEAQVAGTLQLRSSLVGTRLGLPAPLDKASAVPLATTIDVDLPFETGDVQVAFGQRMALRARSRGERTGVRVQLGSGTVDDAVPESGLVATGRTAVIDAADWMALAGGGDDGPALRQVDIVADDLRLLGGTFPSTRVRALPSAGATQVMLDGERLAGSITVPDADGAPLVADLQRLHWKSATPPPAPDAPPALPPDPAKDTLDPTALPPLQVKVADLRVGDARLGVATLRTRRIANGLAVERLETEGAGQHVRVQGEWTGKGAGARTRLQATVESTDFGALLAGFGAGRQVDGGHGEARFDAAWTGSPATFRLAALEGQLQVTVKDGRLVEIEPGAGRVLGLLSVAELPRRLLLDFRDFFSKGFAFNRIGGHVRFAGGEARSDDLVIDGPAAEIRIRGAAQLTARTYDQTIEVLPKTGNVLTAVGAITAGPVGAAVGALANAVLKKPLGELGAKTYHVTGPWKDPAVEVVDRDHDANAPH